MNDSPPGILITTSVVNEAEFTTTVINLQERDRSCHSTVSKTGYVDTTVIGGPHFGAGL
jgi:hypothetical protein